MNPLTEDEVNSIAWKVAHIINKNWALIEAMIQANLRVQLTRSELRRVGARALEMISD